MGTLTGLCKKTQTFEENRSSEPSQINNKRLLKNSGHLKGPKYPYISRGILTSIDKIPQRQ